MLYIRLINTLLVNLDNGLRHVAMHDVVNLDNGLRHVTLHHMIKDKSELLASMTQRMQQGRICFRYCSLV